MFRGGNEPLKGIDQSGRFVGVQDAQGRPTRQ